MHSILWFTKSLPFFLFVSWAASQLSFGVEKASKTSLVQEALQAEAAGEVATRNDLLVRAASYSRGDEIVRWYRGEAKIGGDWQSYEDIVASATQSKALEQYLKRRDESSPTLTSQEYLAAMCQRLGLKEQEKAHWLAVLQFRPDHSVARERLGFVKLPDGKWIEQDRQAELKDKETRVAEAMRKEQASLTNFGRMLSQKRMTVPAVTEQLLNSVDETNIPAWERFLSTANDDGALAVIGALRKMSAPEASQSLIRHAMYHPSAGVQNTASQALRGRDEQSYLPTLVGSLRATWDGKQQSVYDPYLRQFVVRYVSISETQESQETKTLDDVFFLGGNLANARGQASVNANARATQFEMARLQENAKITLRNQKAIELLKNLTGETDLSTPQEWWKWWEEYSESISIGAKPVEVSYAYQTNSVYGLPPSPPVTSSGSRPSRRERHECLAAGTLILTNRGPIGVEKVRLGDLVIARHPATGETTLKPVIQTTNRPPEKLLYIKLGEEIIRASGGHPFWVSGKGWLRARELRAGMYLHGLTTPVQITSIIVEDEPAPSFNLVVADFHSYFVQTGEHRILSHDNSLRDPIRTTVPGLSQPKLVIAE